MELARLTSKGQLTIPIEIRRILGVNTGDQLLFYEKDGQIIISGVSPAALKAAQIAAAENHIYTRDEICAIAAPVAKAHGVKSMRLFGSYARGEATRESDIDFVISRGEVTSLLQMGGLQNELSEAFHKKVDLLADDSLETEFAEQIKDDEVIIYETGNA